MVKENPFLTAFPLPGPPQELKVPLWESRGDAQCLLQGKESFGFACGAPQFDEDPSEEMIKRRFTTALIGWYGRYLLRKRYLGVIIGTRSSIPLCSSGRGSLAVKVTDSWPGCHEFEPSIAEDLPCRRALHVKSIESLNVLPLMWWGIYEKEVPAQVSSSSLDQGSK
ncbi:hypothetical protein TNCV_1120541 [Trichonephila clavipes]|uniref:Uncharacterized protein n=1 Tax=Trichonephila clavipes TaxID=2585209 RepID=A0A8X6T0M0_TRICX|nr:hypothetical protein TNCV_1120541 [Trichonephila clavipes]